jgi:hypothetical protein
VYENKQENTKQNKRRRLMSLLLFSGKITTCRAERQMEHNNVK